jgi:hypothetical protein
MIVTPFDGGYPERLQSQADAEGLTRSPGLHLSTIIRAIEQTIRPKDEWCTQEELAFFGAGGFMWERVFSMAHRDAVETGDLVRPGEFDLDGVAGSPDMIRISDWTLIETKATWRGLRKWESLEKNFWSWLVQTKGYCKMIGSNVCEIHCFFVAGDWRPPAPCVKSIRIEYTDRELEENWSMITKFAESRGWL